MPRYSLEYELKGRIEIDAPSSDDAYSVFVDKDPAKLVEESVGVESTIIDEIEEVENYNE